MTTDEKERMIHIRLDEDVHKDLRKAAADEDTSMQKLVSKVVSRTVSGGKLVNIISVSDEVQNREQIITITLDDEDNSKELNLKERLVVVERLLERMGTEVQKIKELLVKEEEHDEN